MDLGLWLRTLGLEQYEAAFRENAIDVSVLPDLTDQDMEKLGVLLGHRRKLLRAIANLETTAKAALGAVVAPAAVEAPPRDTAERRQVTVMFSDLVGSTALSARMDPEDLREVISAYQKRVAETVQRFGGFVAKYMGDGVLIYYGYPQAHEDDAERAVRAGLELVAAVGALKTHAPLQTRVGIATGLVVVGDLIGSGASQEQAIVGKTPNLAARLQSFAEPNSVVIAETTRKLVGNLFELQDLGAQDLKGISGPVRAWVAARPSSAESRFEAFHASGLTELVGREEELELLLRRWSKAKSGEGQVVLLSGEAGIGIAVYTETLPPAQIERSCPGIGKPSLFIFCKASQRLLPVSEHVRDQPSRVRPRLADLRAYRPRLFVEAIKIAIATVPDHSLTETQAQLPLIELFTVGFSWLGRGAIGPKRVLPAAQICLEHIADGLPNVLDLRYSNVAIVLFFSGVADQKCLFQISFFRSRDDLVKLANPMWFHVLGSK